MGWRGHLILEFGAPTLRPNHRPVMAHENHPPQARKEMSRAGKGVAPKAFDRFCDDLKSGANAFKNSHLTGSASFSVAGEATRATFARAEALDRHDRTWLA